jgi:hypothetical protein
MNSLFPKVWPSFLTVPSRFFVLVFATLMGLTAGQSLFALPPQAPCTGDLVELTLTYNGLGGVDIFVYGDANRTQLLATLNGVNSGDVFRVNATGSSTGKLPATTWFEARDANNPCTGGNCLDAVPSGCNSYQNGRTFGQWTVQAYVDENGNSVQLGLTGNSNRQVSAPPSGIQNPNGPGGNTSTLTNQTIGLNTNLQNGSTRRNTGLAKSGADLDGEGLSYNTTTEELDVNPGDGIAINSDLVEVQASDLDGAGIGVANNNFEVNTGDGIVINADQVEVDASDLAGAGISENGNNLEVNVDGVSIEIDQNNDLRIAAGAAGDGLYGGGNDELHIGDGPGIGVNANEIEVNVDGSTIGINPVSDELYIPPGGISFTEMGTNAVGTGNIIDGTVNTRDIASGGNDKVLTTDGAGNVTWEDKTVLQPAQTDGDGLIADVFSGETDVNPGDGIAVNNDQVEVVATDIEGDGLSVTNNDLNVNTGDGVTINSDNIEVVASDLDGDGLTTNNNDLSVNPGPGIAVFNDQVVVNTFDLEGSGIGVNPTTFQLEVNTDNSTVEVDGSDNLRVVPGGITANEIGTGAVTTDEIQDGTITTQDIGQNGATTGQVLVWNGTAWVPATNDDADDSNNELINSATLNGTDLEIVDAGGTTTVDLSTLNNSGTDDQNLTGATLTGTDLTINIENGGSTTADLSALEESADIAQVANDLQAHITADGDLDATNEYQDLSSTASGTDRTIAITNGTNTTINVADNDDDSSNELQTLSQTGNDVTLSNGGGTISVADNDNDSSNELINSATLNGTNLEIVDAGGTTTVDLSTLNNSGTDDQDLTGATLTGTDLTINIENGGSTTADLSALEESADIAQVANDLQAHITADGDLDATNEFQDLSSTASGNDRTIEITNGSQHHINVADNDDDSSNELINSATLTGTNLEIVDAGGTTTVDLSTLNN